MRTTFIALSFLVALTACDTIPREAYFNRGEPETLLDASSEVVTIALSSERSIDEMVDWIDQDQPTRAELLCAEGEPLCMAAEEVLSLYGVEYQFVSSQDGAANLIYERVLARDCENRFIDNNVNPYHMNHPVFGCSIASNMVQMVSDKRQFIAPALLDDSDADKAVRVYQKVYRNPREEVDQGNDFSVDSLTR